jgi:large subunit ribosomal protein L25
MATVSLSATVREETGKGAARRIRRTGGVPAVLYSHGHSTPLIVDRKSLIGILNSETGEHALFHLRLEGEIPSAAAKGESRRPSGAERMAVIRDYQTDPVMGGLLHVDFLEVSTDEKLRIRVAISLGGKDPAGVKQGGILQFFVHEVEVECLPAQIPEQILLDASALEIGDSIHARELRAPEGVKVLAPPDQVILSIAAPMSTAKLEEVLTGAPTAEVKEPEVLTKKKEEAAPEGEKEKGEKEKGEKEKREKK